jgi:hypothetical protein
MRVKFNTFGELNDGLKVIRNIISKCKYRITVPSAEELFCEVIFITQQLNRNPYKNRIEYPLVLIIIIYNFGNHIVFWWLTHGHMTIRGIPYMIIHTFLFSVKYV